MIIVSSCKNYDAVMNYEKKMDEYFLDSMFLKNKFRYCFP